MTGKVSAGGCSDGGRAFSVRPICPHLAEGEQTHVGKIVPACGGSCEAFGISHLPPQTDFLPQTAGVRIALMTKFHP